MPAGPTRLPATGPSRHAIQPLVAALALLIVSSVARQAASPQPDVRSGRSAASAGPRSRSHFTGAPARRRQGDPLLSAGDRGDQARGRSNDNQVKATLKIAPDCPLGLHDLRLRTATGLSELRTFSVGALKEVAEVEPNNDFAKPQPIAMNVDRQRRRRQRGRRLLRRRGQEGRADHGRGRGHPARGHPFDPYVAILDAKRFELASSDDAALSGRTASPRSSPRRTARTSSRSARAPTRATAPASTGSTSATSRGRRRRPRRRQARRDGRRSAGSATSLGEKTTTGHPARRSPNATSASSPRTTRGSPPIPTPSGSRPFGNVIEAEPNDDHGHGDAVRRPRWPSTA